MASFTSDIASCKYISWFLNDKTLNELLYRADNNRLRNDIMKQLKDKSYVDNINIITILKENTSGDINLLIIVTQNNTAYYHITLHLSIMCNYKQNNIGPFHLVSNIPQLKEGKRLNIYPNINNSTHKTTRLIFYKSPAELRTYNNIKVNSKIDYILNDIIIVLNNYFSIPELSPLSLYNLTPNKVGIKHKFLDKLLNYYNKNKTLRITRTNLTHGGKRNKYTIKRKYII